MERVDLGAIALLSAATFAGSLPLYSQAVNAASGASTVAPGSLVSVYGSFINATGQAVTIPLPTSVGGFFFLLWNGKSALSDSDVADRVPLLYWSPSQINVALPNSAAAGYSLVARENGLPDGSVPLNVAEQAPGIFVNPVSDCSILAAGCGQKLVRGILTDGNYSLIGSGNPTHPGQSLVIWVTGLGITPTWPQVLILPNTGNSVTANVFYTGHTSFVGLDQVNITLPNGKTLSPGCTVGAHIEIQLSMKSLITGIQSNTVSLPVVTDSCN